jgi:AraC family L-rhamnose operon transcriptional activator RhaR
MADEPYLGRLLWAIPLSAKQNGMVSLHLTSGELIQCRKLLDELCSLGKESHLSHFGDQIGLLVQLLSLLARNASSALGKKSAAPHRAIATALKLIDDAPTEPWTLKTLAARAHVEPTYFVRLFRATVGLPPMAYLTRRRLELAVTMLRQDNLPVGDVGVRAGWIDTNYFSRCFRRHFHMTPSKYRARFMHGQ